MSERTPASAARRSSRRARMVPSSRLAGHDELLRGALVGGELDGPVRELALGRLDGAHDVSVAAGDRAHHRQLGDQVAQVGRAEHRVHRAHVVVLVHGDRPRREGGARQARAPCTPDAAAGGSPAAAGGPPRARASRASTASRRSLSARRGRRSPRRWPRPCRGSAGAPRPAPRRARRAPRRPRAPRRRAGRPAPGDVSGDGLPVRLLGGRRLGAARLAPRGRGQARPRGRGRNLPLLRIGLKRRNPGGCRDVSLSHSRRAWLAGIGKTIDRHATVPADLRHRAQVPRDRLCSTLGALTTLSTRDEINAC